VPCFFPFSLVLNVFPLSSQWIPIRFFKFPMCSPTCSPTYPLLATQHNLSACPTLVCTWNQTLLFLNLAQKLGYLKFFCQNTNCKFKNLNDWAQSRSWRTNENFKLKNKNKNWDERFFHKGRINQH
jgi:hypothetical protein